MRTPLRRGALPWAVLGLLLAVSGGLAAPAYAVEVAADEATPVTIDYARSSPDGITMLLSVPGTVDYDSVAVKIGGQTTTATAGSADNNDTVKRTAVLAMDTSKSMAGTKLAEARKAAEVYLGAVPENVKVGIVAFDSRVRRLLAPTRDRDAARSVLATLDLAQETKLYEGIRGSIAAAGPGGENGDQRNVLVLSDGKNTTREPLSGLLTEIKESGATIDVVALQDARADASLRSIARAGGGAVLDAADPAALSTAFASEAAALARQVLVVAEVPEGVSGGQDVAVTLTADGSPATANAFLEVEDGAGTTAPDPNTAGPSGVAITPTILIVGLSALGLGILMLLGLLASGPSKGAQNKAARLREQVDIYGASGSTPKVERKQEVVGIADQARLATERMLKENTGLEAKIATRLEGAGLALKPAEWLLLQALIAILAGFVGLLLGGGSLLLALLFVMAGIVGPRIYLSIKRSRRLAAFNAQLADTLQLMSGSLSAGLSLAQSLDTIVREGAEPINSEFRRVVVESRLGVTLEDALEGVAARMHSRDFGWVVMAIRIQRDVGGNLAELLLTVAATLREREYLRRHVKALSAEGRLSAYVLGGLPPAFLVYLMLSNPDYVTPMLTSLMGWIMLGGGVVLLSVGMFWMMKVAKVDI